MIYVVYALVALAGAGIHLWRHPAQRRPEQAVEVVLLWWIVVTIGLGGIVGGLFHLLDGPHIAREIGFTRGDGGNDNHDPDSTGAVLYADVVFPLVGLLLYAVRERLHRRAIAGSPR